VSDTYSSDCPKPAEHDSHGVTPPSGKPGVGNDPGQEGAGDFYGFGGGTKLSEYLEQALAYQVEPAPGKT
jgi:hypothetical protein